MVRRKTILFTVLALISGCSTTQPELISYDEASAFENSLLTSGSPKNQTPTVMHTQPINKKESCKIPISPDQLERPNFREYWDGECKDGFAFGLGRDIAISDTHHVEEITIHDGSGNNYAQPRINYDYINNTVQYSLGGSKFPEQKTLVEQFANTYENFDINRTLAVVDASGTSYIIYTSAFKPQKIYVNIDPTHSIIYKITDNSAVPNLNQNDLLFSIETIDPKRGLPGGVTLARYANGVVKHFILVNGQYKEVTIPKEYIDHILSKYNDISNHIPQATAAIQQVQQIEREYLYKACNGKSGIAGLDRTTYTQICSWREQFKEPYAVAMDKYQKNIEIIRQQKNAAEQQRQAQQQIALQQQMIQQQQNQQTWNNINQASQQIQQSSQQLLQMTNSWQAPQVQPITSPNSNRVICYKTGNLTTCR